MTLRRPVTTLDWILLKVINFALVPRLGPEINSRACSWVSPGHRNWAPCWLASQWPSLFCKSRLVTPRAGSGRRNLRTVPPPREPIGDFITSYSSMSGGPKKALRMPDRDIIQRLLALVNQRSRCSNGLKGFQGRYTVGADTRVFLRSVLRLYLMGTA